MQLRQPSLQTHLSSQHQLEESTHFRAQRADLNPEHSSSRRVEIALRLRTFLDCQGTQRVLSRILLLRSQVQKLRKLWQTSPQLQLSPQWRTRQKGSAQA